MPKLTTIVLHALEDLKALDINIIDVQDLTSITEYMVIATGNSTKHVKAIADHIIKIAKAHAYKPLGTEGENYAEWILIDLNDVIVHIMLVETRTYYQLDKLWSFNVQEQKQTMPVC